jgi:hypothetical protein
LVGQHVANLLDQQMPAGTNVVDSRGVKLSSGCYMVHVKMNGQNIATYPVIIK